MSLKAIELLDVKAHLHLFSIPLRFMGICNNGETQLNTHLTATFKVSVLSTFKKFLLVSVIPQRGQKFLRLSFSLSLSPSQITTHYRIGVSSFSCFFFSGLHMITIYSLNQRHLLSKQVILSKIFYRNTLAQAP